jgi:hypothetical protein
MTGLFSSYLFADVFAVIVGCKNLAVCCVSHAVIIYSLSAFIGSVIWTAVVAVILNFYSLNAFTFCAINQPQPPPSSQHVN